jgi:hypothetical protein
VTDEGKKRSRQNAVRHGLTAETVIDALGDAEDHAAFEMAVTGDYDAQSAVERELVLRLASPSGLFRIKSRHLLLRDKSLKGAGISLRACTDTPFLPRTTHRAGCSPPISIMAREPS